MAADEVVRVSRLGETGVELFIVLAPGMATF